MKKIAATIKQATLDTVVEALVRIGVTGMMLAHVRGSGRQKGHCELYRGPDYMVDLLPKVKDDPRNSHRGRRRVSLAHGHHAAQALAARESAGALWTDPQRLGHLAREGVA